MMRTFRQIVTLLMGCVVWLASPSALMAKDGAPTVVTDDYRIGPEDVLEISVWREEGLQKQVLVRPDGGIAFPLVGNLQAAGKTSEEVREEITVKLKKYIPDPVVTVAIAKLAGYKIYVIGKVNRPGEFVVGRYVDVMQALTMAGGLTPYAEEGRIKILRKLKGSDTVLLFDYSEVRKGRGLEQNIQLRSGDTVVVP